MGGIETVRLISTEVALPGACEEYRELTEKLRIMFQVRRGESVQIVEVARMAAVDHGFDLPSEQFFGLEHEKLRGRRPCKGRGGENFGRQCAGAHEKVDLDLD